MRTRISKCQSGGKETSINRPSNIYSIIDRREVGFLRRKKNNRKMTTWFFFSMYVLVGGKAMYFQSIVLINSCFPGGEPHSWKANGGPLTAIHETCKRVKNCVEEGKEVKRNSYSMCSFSGNWLHCLYWNHTYKHMHPCYYQTLRHDFTCGNKP